MKLVYPYGTHFFIQANVSMDRTNSKYLDLFLPQSRIFARVILQYL